MPKAKKLPSGMWRCQASIDGERRSFTAWTKREAEFMALEWQEGRREKRRPENLTVNELLTQYIESRSAILSPSTIASYRKMQRLYFEGIRNIRMCKLRPIDVQNEINHMAKTLSPKTIRNAYGLLRSATEIDFKITMPQKKKMQYRTPDIAGIKYILDQTTGTTVEVPVLLALWCGLRMSEIRGLKWDKVKPDRIIIDTAIVDVDGIPVEKHTKTTESTRTIEIPPYLYDKIQTQPHTTPYVTNLSGHAIYAKFKRLTNNICRFHDLRHANASVMMMLGIPDAYAMERGGWETERIYKKTYAQTISEERERVNQRIDDYFINLIAHENAHNEEKTMLN